MADFLTVRLFHLTPRPISKTGPANFLTINSERHIHSSMNESDIRMSKTGVPGALALGTPVLGNMLNRSRHGGMYMPLTHLVKNLSCRPVYLWAPEFIEVFQDLVELGFCFELKGVF